MCGEVWERVRRAGVCGAERGMRGRAGAVRVGAWGGARWCVVVCGCVRVCAGVWCVARGCDMVRVGVRGWVRVFVWMCGCVGVRVDVWECVVCAGELECVLCLGVARSVRVWREVRGGSLCVCVSVFVCVWVFDGVWGCTGCVCGCARMGVFVWCVCVCVGVRVCVRVCVLCALTTLLCVALPGCVGCAGTNGCVSTGIQGADWRFFVCAMV